MLIWDGNKKPGRFGTIANTYEEHIEEGVRANARIPQSYDQEQCLSLAAFLIQVVAKQRGVSVKKVIIRVKRI